MDQIFKEAIQHSTPSERAEALYERSKICLPNPYLFVKFMNKRDRFEDAKAIINHPEWFNLRLRIITYLSEEEAAELSKIENIIHGEF